MSLFYDLASGAIVLLGTLAGGINDTPDVAEGKVIDEPPPQ